MSALKFLCIFSAVVVLVSGQGHQVPGAGEVNHAIVDISMHYSEALCLELLLVDCATHVTQGDEKVCGSNGHTYANHCKFVHAVCEFAHSNPKLTLASHGECPVTTTSSITTANMATAAPVTAATTAIAGAPNSPVTTQAPMTTTAPQPTATSPQATTTVDPIHSIVQNVFCSNAGSISCAGGFEILCGSDGQFYPNQCELSKAKCKDPALTVADMSSCSLPGSG